MTDSDVEISLIFNNYFSGIVSSFNIPQQEDPLVNFENMKEPFMDLLWEKYKNHPSVLAVLVKQCENIFSFRNISKVEIETEVLYA